MLSSSQGKLLTLAVILEHSRLLLCLAGCEHQLTWVLGTKGFLVEARVYGLSSEAGPVRLQKCLASAPG
jgi:hypothetical protein